MDKHYNCDQWQTNFDSAALVIERIIPDEKTRSVLLSDMAYSICLANSLSPIGWNINLSRDFIRFNTARIYMLNLKKGIIGVTVDQECPLLKGKPLPMKQRSEDILFIEGFDSDPQSWHIKMLIKHYLGNRELLLTSQRVAIKRDLTATKYGDVRRVQGRMAQAHSPAAVDYISKTTNFSLPQPKYSNGSAAEHETHIHEGNIRITEGEVVESIAKEYKRNPKAREQCLKIHGHKCKICNFDFLTVYGMSSELIQAHHLSPLSENQVEHLTNPKTDMCPVCPNCHVVIHSKKPPYTIEEVRAMISNNKNH